MELEKAAQEEVVRRARDGSWVATVAMNETRRPPSGRVNGDDARVGIFYLERAARPCPSDCDRWVDPTCKTPPLSFTFPNLRHFPIPLIR